MIKLKNILGEGYAWERQDGKPLPTLKDVQEAYDAKGVEDASDEANEGAKPDYIDADGDGNEEESMKKAFADKEAEDDDYDNDHSDPLIDEEETDMDVLNMGSLEEGFWNRVKGNLHGHEYILREAFRK
jgi:DNA-directed RNA polymerase delta subunit